MADPPFSPEQAAADIQRLGTWQAALARRTSGLCWIVWGLATTGMFMTYDFFGLLSTDHMGMMALFPFLWIPWVVVGIVATHLMWRSAAIVSPGLADPRRVRWTGLLMALFILVGGSILFMLHIPVAPPGVMLAVMGVAYLLQGVLKWPGADRLERGLRLATGLLFLGVTAAVTALSGHALGSLMAFSVAAPAATAVCLCGGGVVLATRG